MEGGLTRGDALLKSRLRGTTQDLPQGPRLYGVFIASMRVCVCVRERTCVRERKCV